MDTKGTKELIRALNPESELRAVAKQEEEFIERARLQKDNKRKSVFKRGINYLKNKMTWKKKNSPSSNSSYKSLTRSKRSKVSNYLPK
jgi:hypothetical protein